MISMLKEERTLLDRAKVGQGGLIISSVQALDTHQKKKVAVQGDDG